MENIGHLAKLDPNSALQALGEFADKLNMYKSRNERVKNPRAVLHAEIGQVSADIAIDNRDLEGRQRSEPEVPANKRRKTVCALCGQNVLQNQVGLHRRLCPAAVSAPARAPVSLEDRALTSLPGLFRSKPDPSLSAAASALPAAPSAATEAIDAVPQPVGLDHRLMLTNHLESLQRTALQSHIDHYNWQFDDGLSRAGRRGEIRDRLLGAVRDRPPSDVPFFSGVSTGGSLRCGLCTREGTAAAATAAASPARVRRRRRDDRSAPVAPRRSQRIELTRAAAVKDGDADVAVAPDVPVDTASSSNAVVLPSPSRLLAEGDKAASAACRNLNKNRCLTIDLVETNGQARQDEEQQQQPEALDRPSYEKTPPPPPPLRYPELSRPLSPLRHFTEAERKAIEAEEFARIPVPDSVLLAREALAAARALDHLPPGHAHSHAIHELQALMPVVAATAECRRAAAALSSAGNAVLSSAGGPAPFTPPPRRSAPLADASTLRDLTAVFASPAPAAPWLARADKTPKFGRWGAAAATPAAVRNPRPSWLSPPPPSSSSSSSSSSSCSTAACSARPNPDDRHPAAKQSEHDTKGQAC